MSEPIDVDNLVDHVLSRKDEFISCRALFTPKGLSEDQIQKLLSNGARRVVENGEDYLTFIPIDFTTLKYNPSDLHRYTSRVMSRTDVMQEEIDNLTARVKNLESILSKSNL